MRIASIRGRNAFMLVVPVKRRWATLASAPSRNNRPELIADDGQGMFFPACPNPLAPARPESEARPGGKKM